MGWYCVQKGSVGFCDVMNLEWFLRHGKHQMFAGVGALTRLYRPMQLKLASLAALLGEPG